MYLHRDRRQPTDNQAPQVPDEPSGRISISDDMTQCAVAMRDRRRRAARTHIEGATTSTTRQDASFARLLIGQSVRLDGRDHVRGGQRHG